VANNNYNKKSQINLEELRRHPSW